MPEERVLHRPGIYDGWAILGLLWPAAIVLNALLTLSARAQTTPLWLAVLAALCFALMLVIFSGASSRSVAPGGISLARSRDARASPSLRNARSVPPAQRHD